MKTVGIVVSCIGVALAAAFGSQLAPPMREHVTAKARAQLLAAAEGEAHAAYCQARGEASLPPADGCTKGEGRLARLEGTGILVARGSGKSDAELTGSRRERLEGLRAAEVSALPEVVRTKREAWLDRITPMLEAAEAFAAMTPPDPGARASAWASSHGGLFGLGLVLVIGGALAFRVAARREALTEPTGADGAQAMDFGQLLAELHASVESLSTRMDGPDAPTRADQDRLKDDIQELQMGPFEQLVSARAKVQARYGMAGFAEIFGPVSSAERYLGRAWSALVDQHWEEARASVERAASDLDQARGVLAGLAA